MSGWSLVAGALVVLAVAVTLLVARRVAREAGRTAEALHDGTATFSHPESSTVLSRLEDLAGRRATPTGRPEPPR
jgi:hypothetical protein